MAVTYNFIGANNTVTDTVSNMELFDPTLFTVAGTDVTKNANGNQPDLETLYKYLAEDPLHPYVVRIGSYPPKGNGTKHNVSVRSTFYVEQLVDSVVVETAPMDVVTSWASPFGPVPDKAQLRSMLLQNLSFILHSVATGAFDDGLLDELQFGVTEMDLSSVSRT